MNDELIREFKEYLERQRGDLPQVEIRLRDVKDALILQFVSSDYPSSDLISDINKIVQEHRRIGRLSRIGSGLYIYHPFAEGNAEIYPEFGYSVGKYFDGRISQFENQYSALESVIGLVESSNYLVNRNTKNIDLESLQGMSF